MRRNRYGMPAMKCQVPRSRPAAWTRISTSSAVIVGRSISAMRELMATSIFLDIVSSPLIT